MHSSENHDQAHEMLTVKDISVQFGGLLALDSVNLNIKSGTRYGILGPNGAGKTTLFNVICGFVPSTKGKVVLNNKDITGIRPYKRVTNGLARTFQITTLFHELTVLENVLMSAQVQARKHKIFWRSANSHKDVIKEVKKQLDDLQLAHLAEREVGALGYGEQRLLEIAVALASKPTVLLLDEPTAGLSSAEMHSVVKLIHSLPKSLTIVMIEHDLDVIFDISEELSVLHFGKMIANGPAKQIRNDDLVKEVYLGSA